jgi:hypothetical protein
MKTKTQTTVICSLTDKEIGSSQAIVLRGTVSQLNPDGTSTPLIESIEGDAYLLSAFLDKLRGEKQKRGPRGAIEHATQAEVVQALTKLGGTSNQGKIADALGKPVHATRKGFDAAVAAGQIVKFARGVYGLATKAA